MSADGEGKPKFDFSAPVVRSISDEEFTLFQQLVYRRAGIYLAPIKKALVVARLGKRLRELGLAGFGAYYRYIEKNAETEIPFMLDRITTNETHFFREPQHFDFLKARLFPVWERQAEMGLRNKKITLWSAACSSGEEPFSLAMLFLSHFGMDSEWTFEIYATDISTRILERARAGVWPISKASEIPEPFLKAFMLKGRGAQEGSMKIGQEIRSMVKFEWLNLNDEEYAIRGDFDLVFCRNALIYFNQESKTNVVNRLIDHLHPNGLLFLGHSESLNGVADRMRNVVPSVYARDTAPILNSLGLTPLGKNRRLASIEASSISHATPAPPESVEE